MRSKHEKIKSRASNFRPLAGSAELHKKTGDYIPPAHCADAPGFRYIGRWHRGYPAVTINTGAMLEFVFPGSCCDLVFDTTGMTQYPDLLVQVDEGTIARHRLDATTTAICLCPDNLPKTAKANKAYWHMVRCWTIISSADPAQWATQNGACKFLGVRCASPDAVLPVLPEATSAIEFLGDSITASLRLLYTGHDGWDDRDRQTGYVRDWLTGQDHQHPVRNWTWHTARLLGLQPIVVGFGGQGLTVAGTIGAPPAVEAFPYVYAGAPWNPPVQPRIVVIYHGTNDKAFTEEQYHGYLRVIRSAYPRADIFAICPHTKAHFASPIRAAAHQAGDHVWFCDYGSGVIAPEDTSDGCHLNPGGAMRLAVRLAGDIARLIRGNTASK